MIMEVLDHYVLLPALFRRLFLDAPTPSISCKTPSPDVSFKALPLIGVRLHIVTAGNGSCTFGTIFTSTLTS